MFLKFLRTFLILTLALSLFSCRKFLRDHLPNTAYADPPARLASAHPDFRQGWMDGCEVGTSSGANTFYKAIFNSNAVDGYKVTESEDYKSAWNAAFWFCYRYQYVKHKSSMWNSFFGGYK